jgi:hypothetical protein
MVCVDPGGHDDLQARRIYRVLSDSAAARNNYARVIDDSGEDYLYPIRLFLPLHLSAEIRQALTQFAASGA